MGTAFSNNFKIKIEFLNDHLSKLEYRDLYSPVVNTKRCTPLIDLLPSNVDTIDYLSLDSEGSELAILKTIPFGKLKINVISVDVSVSQTLKQTTQPFSVDNRRKARRRTLRFSLETWLQKSCLADSRRYFLSVELVVLDDLPVLFDN